MKKIIILGAGGFGKEILSFLRLNKQYETVGFLDPDISLKSKKINEAVVLGDDSILESIRQDGVSYAFVAIGCSAIRKKMFNKICELGFKPINIIHPSSVIADNVILGQGVAVYPHVVIGTNVQIGNSVLINSNATIGHDTIIGDFVNINPNVGIAGMVNINNGAFLGIGCSIIEKIEIGRNSIIGAGAVVIKDVHPETKVYGVPAKSNID